MRTNVIFNTSNDEFEQAKNAVVSLGASSYNQQVLDLFFENDLTTVEQGIKRLNNFSNISWIMSSLLLSSIIYDKSLYQQSGLTWAEYGQQARERLGLEPRDISEQLSAARFFIKYHEPMLRAGWNPMGANRKLARAELALELCKNVDTVIDHLVNDTWRDFKDWYQSFKPKAELPPVDKRPEFTITSHSVKIGEEDVCKFSDKLSSDDKEKLEQYIIQIFQALKQGDIPAIVPVYDEKEASLLPKLRDKYRAKK